VIDMVFTKEQANALKMLISNIPSDLERITNQNKDLEEISKEVLGAGLSEDIMEKVIAKEFNKEIFDKMVGVLFGE
tara:strand:- start:7193 stop:7420 length:228 start_codon:yes stop_codon:yes gene_type:complete